MNVLSKQQIGRVCVYSMCSSAMEVVSSQRVGGGGYT